MFERIVWHVVLRHRRMLHFECAEFVQWYLVVVRNRRVFVVLGIVVLIHGVKLRRFAAREAPFLQERGRHAATCRRFLHKFVLPVLDVFCRFQDTVRLVHG